MYCQYCGKQVDDDAVFCKFCGKKISSQNVAEAEGQLDGNDGNLNVVPKSDSLVSDKPHITETEPAIQPMSDKQIELSIKYAPYYVEQFRAKCGLRCEHRLLKFNNFLYDEMPAEFGCVLILIFFPWFVTCFCGIPAHVLGGWISKILVSKENDYYQRKKAAMIDRWEAKYSDFVEYDEKKGYVYKGPTITDAFVEKPNAFVRFYKKTVLSYIVGYFFYMTSFSIVTGIIALIICAFS